MTALRLAARQHGVVCRVQAVAAGLSPRQIDHRLARGRWEVLFPGVYRVEGAPRTWRQRLKAVSLWAARDFALSHRTAAALWGFARYPEGPVELSGARHMRPHAAAIVHQVDAFLPREIVSIESFRVTSATRTLLDLAAVEPEAMVRAATDEALRRKWATLERLEVAIDLAAGLRGVPVLRALLDEYRGGDGPMESELEARVFELFEAAGLPRPQRQRSIVVANRLRRLDFRLPGTPVIIEADGYATHSSPTAFERDRERNNALTARGWRVLHWTWAALREHPDELVDQLRRTMSALASPVRGGREW